MRIDKHIYDNSAGEFHSPIQMTRDLWSSTKVCVAKMNVGLVFLLLLLTSGVNAQVFPVQVNSMVKNPAPIYYEDYYSMGSEDWKIMLNLIDFNEPYRDVYLRISISTTDFEIRSGINSRPISPTRLTPGAPVTVKGSDLAGYMAYDRANFIGIQADYIRSDGKLPEGFYTFSVEVVDWKSEEILSQKTQSAVWITLDDPPMLTAPSCGHVIQPNGVVNFQFSWQLISARFQDFNDPSEYQLTVFEVLDPTNPPEYAINNGKVIRHFQSDWSTLSNYNYTMADPIFEIGKSYAWYVQVRRQGGRDLYKNAGFSQVCWFSYGYPEGGIIPIDSPQDEYAFGKEELAVFTWDAPKNIVDGQQWRYRFRVTEIHPNQSAEVALAENQPHKEMNFNPTFSRGLFQYLLDKPLEKTKKYAWQVEAFSGEQHIASSAIYTVYGPALLDEFWVNNRKVTIKKIKKPDLFDFAGEGFLTIEGQRVDVEFEHLALDQISGVYVMTDGDIQGELFPAVRRPLSPNKEINDEAEAVLSRFSLTKQEDLRYFGKISWPLPFATDDKSLPLVETEEGWFTFDKEKLTGDVQLAQQQEFNLIDPNGFTLVLKSSSRIFVGGDVYDLYLDGKVVIPDHVLTFDEKVQAVYHFDYEEQLHYITEDMSESDGAVKPMKNANLEIRPTEYIIDLSDSESPEYMQDRPEWKGVFHSKASIGFYPRREAEESLRFKGDEEVPFDQIHEATFVSYLDADGHDLSMTANLSGVKEATFNEFPAELKKLELEVANGIVEEGKMTGTIHIPVLSDEEKFPFSIPISQKGYEQGFLDQSLDDRTFVFNPEGNEQLLNIKIRRAVFENNDCLNVSIDLEWPSFEISMSALDGLYFWGNYNIGFDRPNGTRMIDYRVTGTSSGYELTVNAIGCGRSGNLYSFGLSNTINMGDDVAGKDGPPVANAYSFIQSTLIPEDFVSTAEEYVIEEIDYGNTEEVDEELRVDTDDSSLEDIEEQGNGQVDGILFDLEEIIDEAEANGGYWQMDTLMSDEEMLNHPDRELTIRDVVAMIDLVKPFLAPANQIKAENLKSKLMTLDEGMIGQIYRELKQNGFSIKSILRNQVVSLSERLMTPVNRQIDTVNTRITRTIHKQVEKVSLNMDTIIYKALDAIKEQALNAVGDKREQVEEPLTAAIDTTKKYLCLEIHRSIHASVGKNVSGPITRFVDEKIRYKVNKLVEDQFLYIADGLLNKEANKIRIESISTAVGDSLKSIGKEVYTTIRKTSLQDVLQTIERTGRDAISGIRWDVIADDIVFSLTGAAISDQIKKQISNGVSGLVNELGGNGAVAGNLTGAVLENVDFDFSNLGQKIKEGDVKGIVKFDPTYIKIETKVAKVEGCLHFMKNDSVWGDSWQANLNATVSLAKKEITAYSRFVNGKKPEFKYWFVELGIESGLSLTFVPGLFLDGIGGKVFKKMSYQREQRIYLPDINNKFGAGVDLYFIDATDGTNLRMKTTAELAVFEDYMALEIRGDVGVGFKKTRDGERPAMATAKVIGTGFVGYNSRDKELLGQFSVSTNTRPLLCAGGTMGFQINPDYWNIYVGKKETPIFTRVLCWEKLQMLSWFDIDKYGMEVGLQQDIELWARTPWFKVLDTHVRPYLGFEYHFLAMVDVSFKPVFKLNEALLHLEVEAAIGCEWEKRKNNGEVKKSGDWELVAARLAGTAHYKNTAEEAFIYGSVEGKVKILGVGVEVEMDVRKDLKKGLKG